VQGADGTRRSYSSTHGREAKADAIAGVVLDEQQDAGAAAHGKNGVQYLGTWTQAECSLRVSCSHSARLFAPHIDASHVPAMPTGWQTRYPRPQQ